MTALFPEIVVGGVIGVEVGDGRDGLRDHSGRKFLGGDAHGSCLRRQLGGGVVVELYVQSAISHVAKLHYLRPGCHQWRNQENFVHADQKRCLDRRCAANPAG